MDYSVEEKSQEYFEKKDTKKKIKIALNLILGFPKTLIFNIRYFGVEGLKLPVLLTSKVKLYKLKGKVYIEGKKRFGMIKLGFPASEGFDNSKLSFIWFNDGIVVFRGNAGLHNGVSLKNYGVLEFGNDFNIPATTMLVCYKNIKFGDNVLIGWDCEFVDGDAHKLYRCDAPETRVNENKPIDIGDRVWFGANVSVFKGVTIGNDNVIAANSVITKSVTTTNSVIGGSPQRVLKDNIYWEV